MEDLTRATLDCLEVVAQAEDAAQPLESAADWLSPSTVAALKAVYQSLIDNDMQIALDGIKHVQPDELLQAHLRQRHIAAMVWLVRVAASPVIVEEVFWVMLAGQRRSTN